MSVVNSVDAIFKTPIPLASVSVLVGCYPVPSPSLKSATRASFGIFEKRSPCVLSAKLICSCCSTSTLDLCTYLLSPPFRSYIGTYSTS
mmetsp:Transcript_14534/g.24043  ORF Transcript_14534/g.24043 Transcript_14534/m.24043 type:complete len:89 (+) Transcript_14534:589-855(+)